MLNEIKRGQIVRVRLDPTEGSEQGGERPALVISPDFINIHSPVVLVAAITSRKTDRIYPFEALVEGNETGLTVRSKALMMQIRSVDKRRITGHLGSLTGTAMQQADAALRVAVGFVRL